MTGLTRSTLYPSDGHRQSGTDPSELDWRNSVRDRTQRLLNPPLPVVPPLDAAQARFHTFWSLPEAQRESILKAEQEHREQAEAERLEAARQVEAERLAREGLPS